jgi:uncharacterized membrane protein
MILGLILFFGTHSLRLYADNWRTHAIARIGVAPWKLLYTLVSLLGFVLFVYGYGQVRWETVQLWNPPIWTRHLAALLTIPAFILVVAAFVPGTHMRARLGHPMVLGVKTWAFAHLLSNGSLADLLLFGSFLVWSIVMYAKLRRRDRATGVTRPAISGARDGLAVVLGMIAWAVFALYLHGWLIGVRPFG